MRIGVPCFYALKDSVTPTLVSITSVGLNIVLNVILVRQMGYRGLALGTSIAALFNAGMLFYLLRRRIGGLDAARLVTAFVKISVAAALMGAAGLATHSWLVGVWPSSALLVQLGRVGISIALSLIVLVGCAHLLRIHEWNQAQQRLLGQFRRLRGR